MQYFESAACWSDGRETAGSSSPNTVDRACASARAPTGGSSPLTTSAASGGSCATASRQRSTSSSSSPYRSSWSRKRLPRQTARGRTRRITSGKAASSTSNSPSSAPSAARSVDATPETRFAPEPLCASRCRGRRISAAIAAVVVFPFVAERTAAPSGKPRGETVDRARIELGQELSRHRRPAARAGEARQARHRAGGGDLGGEGHGQAHGRRAYVSRSETASADPFPQRSELCLRGRGLTHSGDVSLFAGILRLGGLA